MAEKNLKPVLDAIQNITDTQSKFQNKLEANPFDYQLKSSREVKPKSEGKSAPRVSEKSKFSIGMSAAKSKESCKSLAKPQSTKNTRSQKFQF